MKPALLLVDLQRDFLSRPGLAPAAGALLARVANVTDAFRKRALPVVHSHTCFASDGSNRMEHLRRNDSWICIEGTPGTQPPPEAEPRPGEAVYFKQVFNAFSNPSLAGHLAAIGADTLVIAGVHLHACVRETALAAYQAGYSVWVVDDAVASYDLLHAEISRRYLHSRGMEFLSGDEIVKRLGATPPPSPPEAAPAAWIEGRWQAAQGALRWERRNPSHWDQVLDVVAEASGTQVEHAVAAAARAQRDWAALPADGRAAHLRRLADALDRRAELLARTMAAEVGKPLTDARGEAARAGEHIRAAVERFGEQRNWQRCGEGVHARRSPLGVVAAVTPFNHPLGIAMGKLAPALALGNAVVWKPALAAVATTRIVIEALVEAGLPQDLVCVVLGDAYTAQRLARQPQIAAVTLTASVTAGRQLAALCGEALKPFQGELGGNNAVIVMGDTEPEAAARALARSAFSFAGQRCTAGRRILVQRSLYGTLLEALTAEASRLTVGDPQDVTTEVGPLISRDQRSRTAEAIAAARRRGAEVLCGGAVPRGLEHGCWFAPTVVAGAAPNDPLFCEESFAPVAVVTPVADFDQAINLANAVPHGLVATLYTDDETVQRRFLAEMQAGVVKLNQPPAGVHPEAPFGGWKASGLGPPEHGPWDEEFYSRPQAVYGFPSPSEPEKPLSMKAE